MKPGQVLPSDVVRVKRVVWVKRVKRVGFLRLGLDLPCWYLVLGLVRSRLHGKRVVTIGVRARDRLGPAA